MHTVLAGVLGGVGGLMLLACIAGIGCALWRRHKRRLGFAASPAKGGDPEVQLADDAALATQVHSHCMHGG